MSDLALDLFSKFNPCHDQGGKFCETGGSANWKGAKDFADSPYQEDARVSSTGASGAYTDKLATSWKEQLSNSEITAVRQYTRGGAINSHLRDGTVSLDTQKEQVAKLDSAIRKFTLPEDLVVYRSVKGVSKLTAGQVVEDKGFVSTSTNRRYASGDVHSRVTKARILLRAGQHAGPIGNPLTDRPGEDEVLLPRGSKFRVVGKTVKSFQDSIVTNYPVRSTQTFSVKYTFLDLEML